jgi:hypothetical protein
MPWTCHSCGTDHRDGKGLQCRVLPPVPKTVVPPSSPPHPAEVNEHLGIAYQLCNKLIDAAEKRGDQVGADAWLVARNAIEAAEKAMRDAREKQTWRTLPGERVDRRGT